MSIQKERTKMSQGSCSLPIPMLDNQDGQNMKLRPSPIILVTLPNPNEEGTSTSSKQAQDLSVTSQK